MPLTDGHHQTAHPGHRARCGGTGHSRPLVLVMVAAVLASGAGLGVWAWRNQRAAQALGAELFEGRRPLSGQVAGHEQALPLLALRCVNCHATGAGSSVSAATSAPSSGPRLSKATLSFAQARRGGPASAYDARAFCHVLRTGIDPAWVQLPRAMPRYQIEEADCAALWAYLNRE